MAWQLRADAATPGEAAQAAGYGSAAAFSRAFARAHGVPPSEFAGSGRPFALEAPNGIHFHPPAGLLIPGSGELSTSRDLTERMVSHHLARVRELLEAAATLPAAELERELRPGLVVVSFEGQEASAALMAERLVFNARGLDRCHHRPTRPRRGRRPAAPLRARRARLHAARAQDP